jgi:hypothetical protein
VDKFASRAFAMRNAPSHTLYRRAYRHPHRRTWCLRLWVMPRDSLAVNRFLPRASTLTREALTVMVGTLAAAWVLHAYTNWCNTHRN